MNRRVVIGLYVAAWATVLISVVFALNFAGVSLWLSLVLAYLLFVILNGSIAYRYRAHKLRLEGKQPPSYFTYLFFPSRFQSTVRVPRLIRVVLGIIVSLGGVLFLLMDVVLSLHLELSKVPHPIGTIILLLILALLGAGFLYVGVRLLIMNDDEMLFKRSRPSSKTP